VDPLSPRSAPTNGLRRDPVRDTGRCSSSLEQAQEDLGVAICQGARRPGTLSRVPQLPQPCVHQVRSAAADITGQIYRDLKYSASPEAMVCWLSLRARRARASA
jgi:hypothetical protein